MPVRVFRLRLLAFAVLGCAWCLGTRNVAAAAAPLQEPKKIEAPVPVTQEQIDAAIDKAARYLLARQELDGSWRPDEAKYVSGQTAHVVYTLLKAGLPVSHPAIERGIAFLRIHPPQWTYGIACGLMAVHTADPERFQPEIEAWTERLMEAHGTGFAYPGTLDHPNYLEDLSLTQYGALGLRVAEANGLKVHPSIWEKLIQYAYSTQHEDGSFSYHPTGRPHTGSMTAAGIAILQISREALTNAKRMGARESRQIQAAIDSGFDWLGEHFRIDVNPDPFKEGPEEGEMIRWQLYYLYGLERVGSLTGRREIGGRNWYKEASNFLVRTQGGDGQWGTAHGEHHPGTCFGILVLKRATAPSSGKRPRTSRSYGDDQPGRPMSIRLTGDTPMTAWVSSFGKRTLRKLEWDQDVGKGPRVIRVEYVDTKTKEILAMVNGDPTKPAKGKRFATKFKMDRPGRYKVRARAYLRPIDDTDGEEVIVLSQVIEVRVDGVASKGMRDATHDLDLNVLRNTTCEVRSSSVNSDRHKTGYAVDGLMCYQWLCKPDDTAPWIEVEPDRPQRADHVVLTPALHRPDDRRAWGRPSKVHITINNKEVGTFDMNPAPFAKTYIPLKKKTVVRELRVEIVGVTKGKHGHEGEAAGFAEVELQLRPELVKKKKRR